MGQHSSRGSPMGLFDCRLLPSKLSVPHSPNRHPKKHCAFICFVFSLRTNRKRMRLSPQKGRHLEEKNWTNHEIVNLVNINQTSLKSPMHSRRRTVHCISSPRIVTAEMWWGHRSPVRVLEIVLLLSNLFNLSLQRRSCSSKTLNALSAWESPLHTESTHSNSIKKNRL